MTKRAELILIFSCLIVFFASFFVAPLFPVQRYPLFADAPLRYETYALRTPSFEDIPPASLELQNTYDGDPTYLVGRLPKTFYRWGEVLTREQLQQHFQSLQQRNLLSTTPICIQKITWSTLPDKSFGASNIEDFAWSNQTLSSDHDLIKSICDTETPL